ncbi:50S ribosomal protein L12 [Cordyceps militaris CM01]|uniref:50S ribosomal protein L12 n=1 Tax=Cordyceps militaris (strain CM01) TaxID=983644 RepID=G3J5J9_CORMM|nr:50S ribosomal protein L12 [Cordyceps militaris CM01]EGX96855.1 50S ribosomal protein L12 [Cordyceps militaris CM01]
MAMSCRYAARTCARQLRSASALRAPTQTLRLGATSRRYNSTEAAATAPTDPKIAEIVDQISKLTLLETADLVSSLKTKLKIPDLPMGGFAAAPAAAPAAEEAEEAAPAAAEKTLFMLHLQAFETASKAKVIKEVKSMLGLSLVESKKFVESAPKMMKENVPKEDAEKIIATMKELGATDMKGLRCPSWR